LPDCGRCVQGRAAPPALGLRAVVTPGTGMQPRPLRLHNLFAVCYGVAGCPAWMPAGADVTKSGTHQTIPSLGWLSDHTKSAGSAAARGFLECRARWGGDGANWWVPPGSPLAEFAYLRGDRLALPRDCSPA